MDVSGTLSIRLERDTDGTGEVFVEATSGGFAGRSSAWFSVKSIRDFALALDAFPIPAEHPPRLAGGFWAKDSREPALEQEHVFLEVRPIGRRGTVLVAVRLATPTWASADADLRKHVAISFLADYALLQEFARAVADVASGATNQAVLASDVTYA
jgi:hypothetical protein